MIHFVFSMIKSLQGPFLAFTVPFHVFLIGIQFFINLFFFNFRTSSTSVEQARERSYHRALLLSKDKDTGESSDSPSSALEE